MESSKNLSRTNDIGVKETVQGDDDSDAYPELEKSSDNDFDPSYNPIRNDEETGESEEKKSARLRQEKMDLFKKLIDLGFSRERTSEAVYEKRLPDISIATDYLCVSLPNAFALETAAPKDLKFHSHSFSPANSTNTDKSFNRESNHLKSSLSEGICVRGFEAGNQGIEMEGWVEKLKVDHLKLSDHEAIQPLPDYLLRMVSEQHSNKKFKSLFKQINIADMSESDIIKMKAMMRNLKIENEHLAISMFFAMNFLLGEDGRTVNKKPLSTNEAWKQNRLKLGKKCCTKPYIIPHSMDSPTQEIKIVQPKNKKILDVEPVPKYYYWIQINQNIQAESIIFDRQYPRKLVDISTPRYDIDMNNNVLLPVQQPEEILPKKGIYPYQKLFCQVCFMYNCLLHNQKKQKTRCSTFNQLVTNKDVKSCGPNCYLLSNTTSSDINNDDDDCMIIYEKPNINNERDHKPNCMQSADALRNGMNLSSSWKKKEIELAEEYMRIFPKDYCTIARILLTKTCNQLMLWFDHTPRDYSNEKIQAVIPTEDNFVKNSEYFPCNHPNQKCTPQNVNCWCAQMNQQCEKFCCCLENCKIRNPGCKCKKDYCNTDNCQCYKSGRECDPDLCKHCNSGDIDLQKVMCKNVNIQRSLGVSIRVDKSDVSGWGAFVDIPVKQGCFIGEYVGELISSEEAEIRNEMKGDKQSYLFEMIDDQGTKFDMILDAKQYGNNTRFVNHSKSPNCEVKLMTVNGDYRIGIYAKRDIAPREELFFDYGRNFLEVQPELVETVED